jgi:hypothetical protein
MISHGGYSVRQSPSGHPPVKHDDIMGHSGNISAQTDVLVPRKRTVYAWVSGNATVRAASAAQLRNRSWIDVIDGVRGFCGVGWQRATATGPWTVAVTSPAELAGCQAVRSALAETGRPFEVVLGGRLPAAALLDDVGVAVASAVLVAKVHNFSGYNVDDESECAPRSTLRNFTSWVHFHNAFAAGLAQHGLLLSSELYATFGIVDAPYVAQQPCAGLHRPDCPGCMDSYTPDPRIAQALSAGGGRGGGTTRWVTMDTYFYTLDHFVDVLDWHRSFLPAGVEDRLGVGLINSIANGQAADGLPLHNVSVEGWAARGHALHAASVEHVSIWLMPLADEFLWWLPRWKNRCEACGLLACWQPTAKCGGLKTDDRRARATPASLRERLMDPSAATPTPAAAGGERAALRAINEIDVLVYGATPGGVAAAIASRRELQLARSHRNATRAGVVMLIEPLHRVGGMFSGGMVDDSNSGNTRAYGGVAAEFFRRVASYYNVTDEAAGCFKGEPSVTERVFRRWLASEGVTLLTGETIMSLQISTRGPGQRVIEAATLTPSGNRFTAKQFIDATYEGDLLPLAGVPVLFGREGRGRWNESLAGQGLCSDAVRNDAVFTATYETFTVAENASVGGLLLAGVDGEYAAWDKAAGEQRSDRRVQSYNFRACLTKSTSAVAAVPITRPTGYNSSDYELFARHIAALQALRPETPVTLAGDFVGCGGYTNGKCDTNDGHALDLAPRGNETHHWALATPAQRVALRWHFVNYTLGLFHFLGTDPRVPAEVRKAMLGYSLCAEEWAEPGEQHLPHIPYIREGRRMDGDLVFTQEDYRQRIGNTVLPRARSGVITKDAVALNFSVGLGFWFIDCHATRRTSIGGLLQNEGCIQYGRSLMAKDRVWEIPFGVMVPPKGSVDNLLSTSALSASHVGFQALRVEPTYMVLGQAAGIASALAIEQQTELRLLGAPRLQSALRRASAILVAAAMKADPIAANCKAGAAPTPPPGPTMSASAVVCGSVAVARTQWEFHVDDGSIRPAKNQSACLTVQPNIPEPQAHHGVAVVLAPCRHLASSAQKWVYHNSTLQTGITPLPHCFGGYSHSECGLLTALRWEVTAQKTVMLWTHATDAHHPQQWTFANGTISTDGPAKLCLAHHTRLKILKNDDDGLVYGAGRAAATFNPVHILGGAGNDSHGL